MKTLGILVEEKDLRKRLLLTIGLIALFRFLTFIPVPWVSPQAMEAAARSSLVQMLNAFSGGALASFTLLATGISAYISASIVVQLLTYALRPLHEMQRAPGGQRKIKKLTIFIGVVMAFFISLGTTMTYQNLYHVLTQSVWYVYLTIACLHAAGTAAAIWIGETITEKGFGNGVSLLIFINILSGLPTIFTQTTQALQNGSLPWYFGLLGTVLSVVMMAAVIVCDGAERRIRILYAKAAARGYTAFGTAANFFPIKLNMTGVMPVIFASTFLQVASMGFSVLPERFAKAYARYMSAGTIGYALVMAALIFAFAYFYSALIFDPQQTADNIQAGQGVIPGIKPGRPTAQYLGRINRHMTTIGATYLAVLSLIPALFFAWIGFPGLASTSVMILVGTALEFRRKVATEAESRACARTSWRD